MLFNKKLFDQIDLFEQNSASTSHLINPKIIWLGGVYLINLFSRDEIRLGQREYTQLESFD